MRVEAHLEDLSADGSMAWVSARHPLAPSPSSALPLTLGLAPSEERDCGVCVPSLEMLLDPEFESASATIVLAAFTHDSGALRLVVTVCAGLRKAPLVVEKVRVIFRKSGAARSGM